MLAADAQKNVVQWHKEVSKGAFPAPLLISLYFFYNKLILLSCYKVKKATIIFLVFIYALSTTGFAMKADYCCNHLTSVKLVLADGAKSKEGCCSVKYQSLKVNDTHAASHVVSTPPSPLFFIDAINNVTEFNIVTHQNIFQHESIHAPPLISSTPVYISNCVFRI